jgi:hypothetical protein
MQENCTCGSVRGALSNRCPYRDSVRIEEMFGGQHQNDEVTGLST